MLPPQCLASYIWKVIWGIGNNLALIRFSGLLLDSDGQGLLSILTTISRDNSESSIPGEVVLKSSDGLWGGPEDSLIPPLRGFLGGEDR